MPTTAEFAHKVGIEREMDRLAAEIFSLALAGKEAPELQTRLNALVQELAELRMPAMAEAA